MSESIIHYLRIGVFSLITVILTSWSGIGQASVVKNNHILPSQAQVITH